MSTTPTSETSVYADDAGWTRLPAVLTPADAADLAANCLEQLNELAGNERVGDKPWAGTRRLVDLRDRLPDASDRILTHPAVVQAVASILGSTATVGDVTFRCPFPGFGEQKLHADDLALTDVKQTRGLTAILALVDFTEENGATRLVPGSHRRPDQQRLSGNLDHHPDQVVLTGDAGDMFVFSRHVLHSGTKNQSNRPRPAIQIGWSGGRP